MESRRMLKALPSKSNLDWYIEGASHEKLGDIPGLRLLVGGGVSGPVDAVAVACKRLGLPIPKVENPHAEISSTFGLRPYQAAGVDRLYGVLRKFGGALLADDVGLGKTRQAYVLGVLLKGRKLAIVPAYVREGWRDELSKAGATSVAVLSPGTTKACQLEWEKSLTAEWVICSYEMAEKVNAHAFASQPPRMVLFDEGHYLCGRKTARSKKIADIAVLATYKLLMTATPMFSRPRDFYQILKILFGSRFGSRSDFDFAYCAGAINTFGGMDNKGSSNEEELRLRLSYYLLRREKKDVLTELPPLTRQVHWLDGTAEASSAFMQMMGYKSPAVLAKALESTLEGKMNVAIELAQQAKRFLLFTYRRSHAKEMGHTLQQSGTPCVVITGDMATKARAQACKLAQSNGWGVVATIDSLGAGVNLQGVASYGIMHSISWLPLQMVQAEGRIHRMGQLEPVQWVYLAMKDSADVVVVKTIVDKLDQWRGVMGQHDQRDMREDLDEHFSVDSDVNQQALREIYEAL